MPYVSRAIRAQRMFELSPLVTEAKAPASSIPACARWSRSKPKPTTVFPAKFGPRRRNARSFLSTTATECPAYSSAPASSLPTRPHPMTTTCNTGLQSQAVMADATASRVGEVKPGSGFATLPMACWQWDNGGRGRDDCARQLQTRARGPPLGDLGAGTPADNQDDRARGLLVRRHFFDRVCDAGDPPRRRGPRGQAPPPGPSTPTGLRPPRPP